MKKCLSAVIMIACLVASIAIFNNRSFAANELIGFYADPNADANGTPYFMVVNALDGNVLSLKDDVNYVFARWTTYPDANCRITPNSNRHGIGIYYADMNTTVPACWYYALIVTAHDGNEWIRNPVTPELRYWDGTNNFIGAVDSMLVKGLDPNRVVQQNGLKIIPYNSATTAQ